jgi:hypothetical protein
MFSTLQFSASAFVIKSEVSAALPACRLREISLRLIMLAALRLCLGLLLKQLGELVQKTFAGNILASAAAASPVSSRTNSGKTFEYF